MGVRARAMVLVWKMWAGPLLLHQDNMPAVGSRGNLDVEEKSHVRSVSPLHRQTSQSHMANRDDVVVLRCSQRSCRESIQQGEREFDTQHSVGRRPDQTANYKVSGGMQLAISSKGCGGAGHVGEWQGDAKLAPTCANTRNVGCKSCSRQRNRRVLFDPADEHFNGGLCDFHHIDVFGTEEGEEVGDGGGVLVPGRGLEPVQCKAAPSRGEPTQPRSICLVECKGAPKSCTTCTQAAEPSIR